ncbi:MAG: type II toxin-antitoxin system RelE/ParE family toxin [Candidatus Omnitrophota bacterium]|jgi:hypothetical protein|nr:MAG: type II toxin-antitoxin system RelE/ParE family toxin [Candidatus Omnitrophota bacterium]
MKVRILPSAIEDLARGRQFYECLSQGLGTYFLDSMVSDMDTLTYNGGIHHQVFGYHRMLAKRFPYAVYYKISDCTVNVFRILDCRQDPNKIGKILEE